MKCEKPVTTNIKKKANAIFSFLYSNRRFCTKDELMQAIGCTNERSVRDIINLLRNMNYCIVSVSDRKGYYLALTEQDLDIVRHAWQEIDSRIDELDAVRKCFKKFYDNAVKNG